MQVQLKEFLKEANITEDVYPGKRIVKPCKQIGDFKNHCVVIDWRNPEEIQIDVRPGLSGKVLAPEVVKQYPVCFQTPTSVKIKVINDNENNEDDDEDETRGKSGKSGSGGKKPARKLEDIELIAARFGDSVEGKIPSLGEIKEMIVLGAKIAKEGFANAFTELTRQINHAQIRATDILSKAADLVKKVEPPSFLKPKGDEEMNYKYDREKNADIGVRLSIG